VERGYPLVVEDTTIRNNGGDGLDLNSRDRGPTPGVLVRRCIIASNHYNGAKLWGSARLENSLLYDMGLTPLVLGAFANVDLDIVNNTVAYNMVAGRGTRGWAVDVGSAGGEGEPAPTNVKLALHNNLFAFNAYGQPDGQTGLYLAPGVVLEESNNLYYSREDGEIVAEFVARDEAQGGVWFSRAEIADGTWAHWTGQGAGDVTNDPRFVAMLGGDFHLQANSPAIDAGMLQGAPTDDLERHVRSGRPDLGAYERAPASARVALGVGWNLVSLPIVPASARIADVLAPIAGKYALVMTYDAATDTWRSYDPALPAGANTLATLDERTAIWIRMNQAATLDASGALPVTTTQALKAGWNLVAFPAGQARPVASALQSIAGKYSLVFGYDASVADPWSWYNPTAPGWASALVELEPGRGYWVRVAADCALVVLY
jgi:hypothetical protein